MSQTTRREALIGAATLSLSRRIFAKASQPSTAVNFSVPAGACDTHTHIFGDPAKFPFWSGRVYTPEPALPAEMAALHRALHLERVVIVTPSIYGTDNSATLYGMKAYGAGARGIAVIDDKTSAADLDSMARAGFKGIRINLTTAGQDNAALARARFQAAIDRIQSRRWHIQMYVSPAVIAAIKDLVMASPIPVVFDHFGGIDTARGLTQPGFPDLINLVRSGRAYVKISGAYRASTQSPDYPDVTPFAKALIAANADRILWGTDWPHPNSSPPPGRAASELNPVYQIDDGRLMNLLPLWAPDAAIRKKILVNNPSRLYEY
ncbi:MAG: amidohydrolase family protein [Acidobacteriota bacterium]|nr:amidohydrolase family protein [Acidobacteriota bacterium]